jgi:cytochrome P450 family 144
MTGSLMTGDIPGTLLLDPSVIENPYDFYRRLRQEAPVWQVPGTDIFVVTSFSLLLEATARVEDFSSNMNFLLYRDERGLPCRWSFGDGGGYVLATADPPDHKIHREAVFSELVAKRMAALEPEIVDVATRCVDKALGVGGVDFMAAVANVVPITLVSSLIGFRDSDLDELLRNAFDGTSLVGGRLTLSQLETLMARVADIGTWIVGQLDVARRQPSEDILGAIARAIEADVLNVGEACVILQTLLSAGGESTTSLMGNSVRLLAEHQDVQSSLREHPDLIPAFVEESLRLESPFRFLFRSTAQDTELGDVHIPAGSTVLLFWAAANRDPTAFPQPDDIDLNRRLPRRHVAFGRGIHHCVGAPLARLEGQVVLRCLLNRTSAIELDRSQPPRWFDSLQVRRHESLPVLLTPA